MLRWLLLAILLQLAAAAYVQQDLVANRAGLAVQNTSVAQASVFNPRLINPWGIAFGPSTPAWIAGNRASFLSLISGAGAVNSLSVSVDSDSPTGLVANPFATDFLIANSTPSLFITATNKGNIWAWGPTLSNVTQAVMVASSSSSAFKGLATGSNGTQHFLFATDFANKAVVVFDSQFNRINLTATNGSFVDPTLPSGFSPFGIANIQGALFVSYALQNASNPVEQVEGAGLGFVSVFDANGNFIRRFASRGTLNAPWGMVLAPLDFGEFGGRMIIGNFGNGRLWAYDLASGVRLGQLRTASDDRAIVIDNLWGLAFGNGVLDQPTNTLFFNAGINDEADGLFGRIDANLTSASEF